jgi:hypothetical protein
MRKKRHRSRRQGIYVRYSGTPFHDLWSRIQCVDPRTTHKTDGQTEIVNQWLEQYIRLNSNLEQSNVSTLLPIAKLCSPP